MIKPTFCVFFVLLACCVVLMQGLPTTNKCLCREGMLSVNMGRVAKIEYYRPTSSCDQEELLVTFKNGQKLCLNVKGDQGRRIKEAIMKKRNVNQGSSD
ncbi:growth-regulated alpha protein-like [Pseudonaja textilis]|uniref:Growth-regulated alpha protein-like n=1 Tax=Pseudonaja textilis TaxID=8673 RepID=A0A670ZU80_PSETE|nr:growth-regulated alpha protein-like [Pseudonaja textilis]